MPRVTDPVGARTPEATRGRRDALVAAAVADGRLANGQSSAWRAGLEQAEQLVAGLLAGLAKGRTGTPGPKFSDAEQAIEAAWDGWTQVVFPDLRHTRR